MNDTMFMTATRKKYRFPFNGQISVEDLWDLTLTQLDRVYKALAKDKKAGDEESLMATRSTEDAIVDQKIEIVKFIFETKNAEKMAAFEKAEADAKKKRIREIIASKKDAELENKSIEELEKLLAE